ncbi:MAG: 3-dehydroquinate synthase [Desulfuromonadaceae bacterium]|nr:3-dehydroquinate synthase [Desulfuromonadaceae bacterium]
MQQMKVELAERSYYIVQGDGSLTHLGELLASLQLAEHVVVITNDVVGPLYGSQVEHELQQAGYRVDTIVLPDGEEYKNAHTLDIVYTYMLERACDRNTTIVALGGGVIGDMAGFAAATYMRGIPFVQIPTTLLAQVDSSVGGKTAINHPLGKNMIGAFYQPLKVVIDTSTLDTLEKRHFRAGLAEVVKYGIIADGEFFAWIEDNFEALLRREPAALGYAIMRCCSIKADIVARDETEQSVRALLNFGHTFGHAVEQLCGYGVVLHGEAVSIGMVVAARISAAMGFCTSNDILRVEDILYKCGLPTIVPAQFTSAQYVTSMMRDKKVSSGRLRMVLNQGIGSSDVYNVDAPERIFSTVLTHKPVPVA